MSFSICPLIEGYWALELRESGSLTRPLRSFCVLSAVKEGAWCRSSAGASIITNIIVPSSEIMAVVSYTSNIPHGFWNTPCLGPYKQKVGSLCLCGPLGPTYSCEKNGFQGGEITYTVWAHGIVQRTLGGPLEGTPNPSTFYNPYI